MGKQLCHLSGGFIFVHWLMNVTSAGVQEPGALFKATIVKEITSEDNPPPCGVTSAASKPAYGFIDDIPLNILIKSSAKGSRTSIKEG